MSISRIYQPVSLNSNQELRLDEAASHHLARVLRAAIGDRITVFNGQGGEYEGEITQIDKRQVTVQILQFSPREAESPLNLCLAQGIARGEKMDYIIQKAVELGVNEIMPLMTERSTIKLDPERSKKRLEHWQSIVISAAQQCGRNRIPLIRPPIPFSQGLACTQTDIGLILSPLSSQKLDRTLFSSTQRIILLIGPEGGFSEAEMRQALAAQCLPLNLGPRILRTETASVAAISLLQSLFGDMG